MSKILIKESEIRQYVRSLIKESFQTEERGASPALINKWINATPEEVNSWEPDNKIVGYNDLVNMVNRRPYNRRGFSPKAKDIEKAWRAANGLEPFPSNVKKIHRVNADGSWESDSQSQEKRKANINAAAKNWQHNKTIQNREIRDTEKAEQARLEAERIAKEQAIRNFEEMMDWCIQNNIDPYSESAKAQYEQAKQAENDKWYYDRGLDDEFSRSALLRRMKFLQAKIDELEHSSDEWDKKVVASCDYCLNDTKKQLNRWFKGKEKIKPLKQEDNLDVNTIGQDAKAAAINDMYSQDFLNWCKQFGCEPGIPTKEVYDSYMNQYNKWCNSNGIDPSDPTVKETFNEFYSDYTKQQLSGIETTSSTPQPSNTNINNDIENDMMDDDDNGRGYRDRYTTIGQLDDPYETSDDEYNSWCIENDLDPNDEENRQEFNSLYGRGYEDEYNIEDVDDKSYNNEDSYDIRY